MRLGIAIEETWDFFVDIYDHLAQIHDVTLFERRKKKFPILNSKANKYLFRRDLEKFLKSNDVAFFEWASGLLVAATHLPKHSGIVTRLHRYELYRWVHQVNWDAVDKIILVSHAKEEEFRSRFPGQHSKIVVIPEAISLNKYKYKPKKFSGNIGILCHLRPRKRVYELILAFYELTKLRNDLRLHIGGGPVAGFEEYYAAIQMLVKELELKDRITFYGNVSDPATWYRSVDIFISNSYSEGLQVSPMEAIASGCYCLAHHWDGADELLPAKDLYLSDLELIALVQDFSEASDAEKEKRRTKQRESIIRNFDVNKTRNQICQVLEEVAIEVDKI